MLVGAFASSRDAEARSCDRSAAALAAFAATALSRLSLASSALYSLSFSSNGVFIAGFCRERASRSMRRIRASASAMSASMRPTRWVFAPAKNEERGGGDGARDPCQILFVGTRRAGRGEGAGGGGTGVGGAPPSRLGRVEVFLEMEAVNSRNSFSYSSNICVRSGGWGEGERDVSRGERRETLASSPPRDVFRGVRGMGWGEGRKGRARTWLMVAAVAEPRGGCPSGDAGRARG